MSTSTRPYLGASGLTMGRMNKQREAASKCEGKGSVANVPRLVRADAGLSNSGPPAARPSVTASPNKIPSIAGLTDFSSFHSAQTFSTDFNLDDVRDGGDVAEGAITPGDFLRMASGVSTAKTDKALPPLPLDVSYLLFSSSPLEGVTGLRTPFPLSSFSIFISSTLRAWNYDVDLNSPDRRRMSNSRMGMRTGMGVRTKPSSMTGLTRLATVAKYARRQWTH